jgi:hypothetical protein
MNVKITVFWMRRHVVWSVGIVLEDPAVFISTHTTPPLVASSLSSVLKGFNVQKTHLKEVAAHRLRTIVLTNVKSKIMK